MEAIAIVQRVLTKGPTGLGLNGVLLLHVLGHWRHSLLSYASGPALRGEEVRAVSDGSGKLQL